jgi:peptide-methionine (S)-S-oxide reductase
VPNPTYHEVCGKNTGHAEMVQVAFDPQQISLRDIFEVFFTIHNPTTPNRQGADVGPQYRSITLYHNDEQKRLAEEVIADFNAREIWTAPLVMEVEPMEQFYPAEEEHQNFNRRNPNQAYCQAAVALKVAKLRKQHTEKLRK